jgi:Rod binding domain-containing protein
MAALAPTSMAQSPTPNANSHLKATDKVSALANTPAGRKLKQAASEFESMLLSSLWKSMKSTFADDGDNDSLDAAHDSLDDWSIQTMSSAAGKAGGIGLGNVILKHLMPKLEASHAAAQPAAKVSGFPVDTYS